MTGSVCPPPLSPRSSERIYDMLLDAGAADLPFIARVQQGSMKPNEFSPMYAVAVVVVGILRW